MSTENLIPPVSHENPDGEGGEGDALHASRSVSSEEGSEQDPSMFGRDKEDSKPLLYLRRMNGLSCCGVITLTVCAILVLFSIIMLAGGYHAIANSFVREQLVISNGTEAYDLWRVTPVPLQLRLYLFNLTNPDEVKKGFRPIIEECGPYVWRELHEKQNITFHRNDTVTYYQQRWWLWDQEASGSHTKDDPITTINVIPVSVAWSTRHSFSRIGIDVVFIALDEQAIINTTAGKILFDGVEDPFLDWIQEEVVPKNGSFHWALEFLGNGGLADYDKFAWFYKRNMSVEYDGLYNMKTGAESISNLGVIDWWNREHNTSFYTSPCNDVKGSAGELFPPNLGKDKIVFFSSDLCMSATLFYKEDVTSPDHLKGYRFWGTNHTFANGSVVPGNECYCVNEVCAPTGLLNAESCRMGAPAFLSFPHFFNADPFLLHGVIGLAPNETRHQFTMDIIPELGVPMRVTPRIQINLRIRPDEDFGILRNLPDVYFPMLWFEILGEMTPSLASRTRAVIYVLTSPVPSLVIWLIVIAVCLVVSVTTIACHCRKAGGDSERFR